jgi:6-phosphogluconolactonase
MSDPKSNLRLYVGTYTGGASEGIYLLEYCPATGAMRPLGVTPAENPSFLATDPQGRWMYAVDELPNGQADAMGIVSAYAIEPASGALELLNQQPTHGTVPCYVSVDATGVAAMVANYGSGSVASYPIGEDGTLGEAASVHQHQGAGDDPRRQEGPHAHSILPDRTNRRALAADLGIDQIRRYQLDAATAALTPAEPVAVDVAPGSGPRHLAFSHDGRYLYAINELGNTVMAYAYDGDTGALTHLQTINALPAGWSGTSYCADLHLHPNGRWLYGSNRGHDSIVGYAVDAASGQLSLIGHWACGGAWPRNFCIDPAGKHLLVANQNSDNVVVFAIDGDTGAVTPTGQAFEVSKPVCLLLLPARA